MEYSARVIAEKVLKYCIECKKPISNLQLQKILYYIQIGYYKREKSFIIRENFEAWKFGPVIRDVYYDYCENGANEIKNILDTNIEISRRERIIINKIVKEKIKETPWDLVKESHRKDGAWYRVYYDDNNTEKIIDKDMLIKYEI